MPYTWLYLDTGLEIGQKLDRGRRLKVGAYNWQEFWRLQRKVRNQGKKRQGNGRQGKAKQGKARQGKARQGKARQGKARQGKAK